MEIRFQNLEELINLIEQNAEELSRSRDLSLICTGEHCSNIDFSNYNFDLKKMFGFIGRLNLENCTVVLANIDEGVSYFRREPKISFKNCNIGRLENLSYDGSCGDFSVEDSFMDFSEMGIDEQSFFKEMFSLGRPSIKNTQFKCKGQEFQKMLDSILREDDTNVKYSDLVEFDQLLGYNPNIFLEEIVRDKKVIINTKEELDALFKANRLSVYNLEKFGFSEEFMLSDFSKAMNDPNNENKDVTSIIGLNSLGYSMRNEGNQIVCTVTEITPQVLENIKKIRENGINIELELMIPDVSKLSLQDIDDLEKQGIYLDRVFIKPQRDESDPSKVCDYKYSHTSYSLDEYKKCRKVIDEILSDVEERNPDGSNEFDIFMQIYSKMAYMMEYNDDAIKPDVDENVKIANSNLTSALLEGKTICAGYAETLRNVLACRGIDCLFIGSEDCIWRGNPAGHAFNQVKINGKWYYTDLTMDREFLIMGDGFENCLLSKEDFQTGFSDDLAPAHIPLGSYITKEASETYPREEVQSAYEKCKSAIFDEHREEIAQRVDGLFEGIAMYNRDLDSEKFDELKRMFWEKDSSGFEQGMLEIGKQLGWIKSDATYGDDIHYNFNDRYNSVVLMNRLAGIFAVREERKKKMVEWYEKLGLKSSDLESLINLESVEMQQSQDMDISKDNL